MLKDFKAFILGVTFAAVITSLVNDIIMPAVGLALGGLDFTSLFAVIKQGATAGPYHTVAKAHAAGAVTINYAYCFTAIPRAATRCPACTSQLAEGAGKLGKPPAPLIRKTKAARALTRGPVRLMKGF